MCDDWDNTDDISVVIDHRINTSEEEKKILERKLVEESDVSLSKELFGTTEFGKNKSDDKKESTNITLKTKQHHEKSAKKPEIKKKSNKNYDDVFGRSENTDVFDENYGSIADKY